MKEIKPIDLPGLPECPLVSILMANYNYRNYLGAAIQSVINQTYSNWELIVVDDGSMDGSSEIIKNFVKQDKRIKLIEKKNEGVAIALNRAFESSQGEIVCLLDSDDIYCRDKIELTVRSFARNHDSGISVHKVLPIDSENHFINLPLPSDLRSGFLAQEILAQGGDTLYFPPASGLSFRREIASKIFPIPSSLLRAADSYLRFCAAILSNTCSINEVLAFYRIHGSNITAALNFSERKLEQLIGDHIRLFEAYTEFLKMNKFPTTDFSINNSPIYLNCRLAMGIYKHQRSHVNLLQTLDKSFGWRRFLWLILYKLPSKISVPLFEYWWSNHRTKTLLKRVQLMLFYNYARFREDLTLAVSS